MKKYGVVRALWGDVLAKRKGSSPPDSYCGVLREVRRSAKREEQTDLVCIWGKDNYRFCESVGLKNLVLMNEDAYGSPKLQEERSVRYGGMVYWGVNHFWHKWQALLKAFETFDSIMSVDWDCVQKKVLTTDWWEKQEEPGVPFRATLTRQNNCGWAAKWRRSKKFVKKGALPHDAGFVPYCGCMWLGDVGFVERCFKRAEKIPYWMQQQCVARELDSMHGDKWIGVRKYRHLGYEPSFLRIGHQLRGSTRKNVVWVVDTKRRK